MVLWSCKSRAAVYSEVILMSRNAQPPVWAGQEASPIQLVWAGWHSWSQHCRVSALTVLSTEVRIKAQSCRRNPLFRTASCRGWRHCAWVPLVPALLHLSHAQESVLSVSQSWAFFCTYLQRLLEGNITQGSKFCPLMARQGMRIRTIFLNLITYPLVHWEGALHDGQFWFFPDSTC